MPQEIKLRFKYRSDKNGVKSYGSKCSNNNPKKRNKLGGKFLAQAQADTRENQRVIILTADGRTIKRRKANL